MHRLYGIDLRQVWPCDPLEQILYSSCNPFSSTPWPIGWAGFYAITHRVMYCTLGIDIGIGMDMGMESSYSVPCEVVVATGRILMFWSSLPLTLWILMCARHLPRTVFSRALRKLILSRPAPFQISRETTDPVSSCPVPMSQNTIP